MKTYLDNLRPFERRVVVVAAALFFVVLNFWLVFPHFSDWSRVQDRMFDAQKKLGRFQAEIAQTAVYSNQVKRLQSEGFVVPPEDQTLHFQSAVQSQSEQNNVHITQNSRITIHTNQFFLELTQSVNAQSGEQELVNFLYNLGSGNSLIRVRSLNVHPDAPRQQLLSGITLVASYQKKLPVKPAAPGRAPANSLASVAKSEPPSAH